MFRLFTAQIKEFSSDQGRAYSKLKGLREVSYKNGNISRAVVGSKGQWFVLGADKAFNEVWRFGSPDKLLFNLKTYDPLGATSMTVIDDRWLVIGYRDCSIHIYSLQTGREMITYKFDMGIFDVRFDGLKLWMSVGSDEFVALEKSIKDNALRQLGFNPETEADKLDLYFNPLTSLEFFKSLEIFVKEHEYNINATELGAGFQNAIVLAV